jgi:hypothetical protein
MWKVVVTQLLRATAATVVESTQKIRYGTVRASGSDSIVKAHKAISEDLAEAAH